MATAAGTSVANHAATLNALSKSLKSGGGSVKTLQDVLDNVLNLRDRIRSQHWGGDKPTGSVDYGPIQCTHTVERPVLDPKTGTQQFTRNGRPRTVLQGCKAWATPGHEVCGRHGAPTIREAQRTAFRPDRQWVEVELYADLERQINDLPVTARMLFRLRYWGEMSVEDVCDRMGITHSVYAAKHGFHYEALSIRLGDYFGEWFTEDEKARHAS
jgi:hypothetical protein